MHASLRANPTFQLVVNTTQHTTLVCLTFNNTSTWFLPITTHKLHYELMLKLRNLSSQYTWPPKTYVLLCCTFLWGWWVYHISLKRCVHICTQTQTRQAEERHIRTYALIATRGKMLSFAEPVNDSLWSTDSRWIAFIRPQTKQRQFSSPWLHIYIATHATLRPTSRMFLF